MSIGPAVLMLAQAVGLQQAEMIYYKPLERIFSGLPSRYDTTGAGSSFVKFIVAPDGKPIKCVVLATSGNDKLDRDLCRYIENEFRYRPATEVSGQPTFGVFEQMFNLYDRQSKIVFDTEADYAIDIASFPGKGDGTEEVSVDVQVDETGALAACAVPDTYIRYSQSGPHHVRLPKPRAALSKIACEQLPKMWEAMPETGGVGQPISYVRPIRVLFRVSKAGRAKESAKAN